MRKLVKRPTPSMTVAITALVAAVGGTAIATPIAVNSVLNKKEKKQTKNIAKNQANNAITQRAPGLTVGTANTVPDGAVGTAKLADNAVTASKLGPISRQTDSPSVPANDTLAVDVDCNPGGQVVSGGWFIAPGDNVTVTRFRQQDDDTWAFTFRNTDGVAHGVDAIAICVNG